jgi:hypothetical protein
MGKFDKRVNKHEPKPPSSIKTRGKKSTSALNAIEGKMGKGNTEKDRNLRILNLMQRGSEGAAANQNSEKMVKKFKSKEQKYNRNTKN